MQCTILESKNIGIVIPDYEFTADIKGLKTIAIYFSQDLISHVTLYKLNFICQNNNNFGQYKTLTKQKLDFRKKFKQK